MARSWSKAHHVMAFDRDAILLDGVTRVDTLGSMVWDNDLVIVLAVKPQSFAEIAVELASILAQRPLILSIMAGITTERIGTMLGGYRRVVRAMPNTPASIGRGITAAFAGEGVSPVDRVAVDALLAATGEHLWLDQESDMDLVTAISGSGPAYYFCFTEALAEAGVRAGLSPAVALQLARATFTGAAALADDDAAPLATLREEVTSPGGTTAAGLEHMKHGGAIDALMEQVVAAAASRSRELAR